VFVFFMNLSVVYGGQISSVEFKLMALVNQQRTEGFVLNSVLCRVAEDHAIKLFVGEFDAAQKIEADSYLSVEEAGYRAIASNEMTAMVVFSNYLTSEDAARVLFESLEKQATDMQEEDADFLSGFSEVGISVYETAVFLGRRRYNVYLAVLIYAQPVNGATENHIMEARLKNLINQARTKPLEVIEWAGISLDSASEGGVIGSLSPVNSAELQEAGTIRTYSYASMDTDPNIIVEKIFSDLLVDELVLIRGGNPILFAPEFNGVDIQVARNLVAVEDGYALDYVAKVGFGNIEPQDNMINGLFYSDDNLNNLYDAGEGLSRTPMIVWDAGIHSRTGMSGEIMEQVETPHHNGYQVILFPDDHKMVVQNVDITENRFLTIQIQNKSLE